MTGDPRVFGLPPGADFPRLLARGLIRRFASAQDPAALARVTVFLNTARMRNRVAEALADGGARLLPRLRLVADLGGDPAGDGGPSPPALRRRLELAGLIRGLIAAAPGVAAEGSVFPLADSLATLIDEMQSEGVAPERIAGLDVDRFSAHWARTRDFMALVAPFFADDRPDVQARQRRAVLAQIARWQATPPSDPVVVAGSTGSRGATLMLMTAVAGQPRGALVLPGLDRDLPAEVWADMAPGGTSAQEDHPQFRFRRLCDVLALDPAAIPLWDDEPPPDPARNRLVSLALRPAPVTDQWRRDGDVIGPVAEATARMSLVEAASPRAEAGAIALILRKAVEDGRRAALVTPDRALTRRVAAALDRWGIVPDDSAGEPLRLTAPGRFLRQLAGMMGQPLTAEALVVLLKHPIAASGADRGAHLRLVRRLEIGLRQNGPPFPTPDGIAAWALPSDPAWADWAAGVLRGLDDPGPWPLGPAVTRLRTAAETLAAGPGGDGSGALWLEAAGAQALAAMDLLAAEASAAAGPVGTRDLCALVDGVLAEVPVRATVESHPGVMIWGTLEARAQGAELVVLGGLNDGSWPPQPAPDPWLNRRMRAEAGLLSPERQVGLSAHDFQQAIAAPEVVLTRALRDDQSGTVPSRWLNRLTGLVEGLGRTGGPEALAEMRRRGAEWLRMAAAIDQPQTPEPPARRPSPRPPRKARPKVLTVTEIATLLRDPYAIYARHVLRLRPIPPLRAAPDARLDGIALHRVMEHFALGEADGTDAGDAARLARVAAGVLAEAVPWPAARVLLLAGILRAADLLTDAGLTGGAPVATETDGARLVGDTGVTLRGRPDRIDRRPDGRLFLIDYKKGSPPSATDQKNVDRQLQLLAAMAAAGAFCPAPEGVAGAAYVALGKGGVVGPVDTGPEALSEVWDWLVQRVERMLDPATGFTARRSGVVDLRGADYAHLSRHGEWQMSDRPVAEDMA